MIPLIRPRINYITLRSDTYYIFIHEVVNGKNQRREEYLSRDGRGSKNTELEDDQEGK
jgi:hypothetical protein